jgi:DNA-binding MarR family transcriptional regulator
MEPETPWYETLFMPALLRHAWGAYGGAMRQALAEAGYDDIPKNGLYVIGGMAIGDGTFPLGQLVRELNISKQAAGQLVDTLVLRGYLARASDEEDRRRMTVSLTERGRAAAATQALARAALDDALLAEVGQEDISRTRRTLAALFEISRRTGADRPEDD